MFVPDGRPATSPRLLGEIWQNALAAFRTKHNNWWQRVSRENPVYTLPEEVVLALEGGCSRSSRRRSRKSLIEDDDAEAERDFVALCDSYFMPVVGVWGNRPLVFHAMAGTRSENAQVARLHHQVLGYIGWLLANNAFSEELLHVKARWLELPDHLRFPVGLEEPCGWLWSEILPQTPTMRDKTTEFQQFHSQMCRFTEKWQLQGLLTWELPVPRSPLVYAKLADVRFMNPSTLVVTWPFYYDLPSSDDLRQMLREAQRQAAMEAGHLEEFPITQTSPRHNNPSQYESAFRFWLIEHTVRSRYGDSRGMAASLVDGLTERFRISPARFKSIRKLFKHWLPSDQGTKHE